MSEKPFLSVIMPCFNEETNLRRGVLGEVAGFLNKQKYGFEVIVVDDGSTDQSRKLVDQFSQNHPGFRLLKNPHRGKAFAIKKGVEKARGKIVLFTDMDQSTPLDQVTKMLPFFKKGYQVVIGSRGQTRAGFVWWRKLASGVFGFTRRLLLLRQIIDTQCGFKAFTSKTARDLFSRLLIFQKAKKVKGWKVGAFDVELLFIAQKQGYRMAEVPVAWQDKDIAKGKERKFLTESKEMLKEILRVKGNDLKGRYD